MSANPVSLAAVSSPASSQSSPARKPSNSDYDPGTPGFAQTLAERRQAHPSSDPRADSGQAGSAKMNQGRSASARDPADTTGKQTQGKPQSQAQTNDDAAATPTRAKARPAAKSAGPDAHPPAQQIARTDAGAANAADTQPGNADHVANASADANALTGTGTGQAVTIGKATAAEQDTSDDRRSRHAAGDQASAKNVDPHADKNAPQPLIGLLAPAPPAQDIRIAGQGSDLHKSQRDGARVAGASSERQSAGNTLQARAGAEPRLQRAGLASALGLAEGGASARNVDSIDFARHIQRAMPQAAEGAGARGLDAGNTPTSLNTLAPATHMSASAMAAASPAAAAPAASAVFTAALDAPVGSNAWSQAVTRQSLRLSHADGGRAELTLYPRDLGQLQVSLKMGEQAQLHFSSPHAHVRAAVESALPQLRQAFAESGIALGDTSVSDQRPQQNFSDERRRPVAAGPVGAVAATTETGMAAVAPSVPMIGRSLAGGIDIFA